MMPSIDEFRQSARSWLASRLQPRTSSHEQGWGDGSDSVAVFHNFSVEEERATTDAGRAWEREKFDAGWGALSWEPAYGGKGLPRSFERAFASEEARFAAPLRHEIFSVTKELVAPTIGRWGTDEQKRRYLPSLLRTDQLCCQLFSEPDAGSDLGGVTTKAVRDGDDWVITGRKVWSSQAGIAELGEAITRTDGGVSKHDGLTAFIVPMDSPGITIRPIRQMTGGSSFNEVCLDDVRVSDEHRLGPIGSGWLVALTTLGAERASTGGLGGGTFRRLAALAEWLGRRDESQVRLMLADVYIQSVIRSLTGQRVSAGIKTGNTPGPEGSIGKLFATETMKLVSDTASHLLGPRLTADTGEWGTYAWSEWVLGAPGFRIAAGSDEIQRNIIGERVLGLPREPSSASR